MLTIRAPKILDFDIENRPLSYMGGDLTTAEITAIAWAWSDGNSLNDGIVHCDLLGDVEPEAMLINFAMAYASADIVTGHYIRKHDLPHVNGALVEYGLPTLDPKLTIDTHGDLKTWSFTTQPKSQEELAWALGVQSPKIGMPQHAWREANRLTSEGLALTRERVVGDVKQHMALRKELTRRNLLTRPKVWTP